VLLLLQGFLLDLGSAQGGHSLVELNAALHCDQLFQLGGVSSLLGVQFVEESPVLGMVLLEVLLPPLSEILIAFAIEILPFCLLLVVDHRIQLSFELLSLLPRPLQSHCLVVEPLLLLLLPPLVGHEVRQVVLEGLLQRVVVAHRLVQKLMVLGVVDAPGLVDLPPALAGQLLPPLLLVLRD
jgi:hypothetical protein